MAARAPIAILTDFGYRDHYAGVLRGVIESIAPGAHVIDITHGIPPQSIVAGALALQQSWRFFPPRTIFLAVVDPGVGSARKPIAIATRAGARFVGPDNGVLSLAAEQAGIARIVELRSPRYRLAQTSTTFHGRDIFAPAAAHLSRGVRLATLGPPRKQIERIELAAPRATGRTLRGTIVYVDGFGNLVSNIDRETYQRFAASFRDRSILVRLRSGARFPIRRTYAEAPIGSPLAAFGSFGLLEVAIREGSAAERMKAAVGADVVIEPGTSKTPR